LRRSLAAEYVLVCAVLSVTAVLTGFFSPSRTEREAAAGRLWRAHDGAAYLGERRAVGEVN